MQGVNGDAIDLPDQLGWDGRDGSGILAPEGSYTATPEIDYDMDVTIGKASSAAFLLVTTPPFASFSPNQALFPYASGAAFALGQIMVTSRQGLAKVAGWSLDEYGPSGAVLKSFSGTGGSGKLEWDGKGTDGSYIVPATSCSATLSVVDEYGGTGSFVGSFAMSDKPSAAAATLAPRRAGFSSTSLGARNTIDTLLNIPAWASVSVWKAEITRATKGLIRSYSGDGSNLPECVRWGGKDDKGTLAEQETYCSVLPRSNGRKFKDAVAKGPGFSMFLDVPTGSVTVDPRAGHCLPRR